VRNPSVLEEFERAQLCGTRADPIANRRIFEALFARARALGLFPLADPLDGIEVDVERARRFHVRAAPCENRTSTR